MAEPVTIVVDGRRLVAAADVPVAVAMLNAGIDWFRRGVRDGTPRGPLCGMGMCHECRVTIDGVEHRRACVELCAEGMVVQTTARVPVA